MVSLCNVPGIMYIILCLHSKIILHYYSARYLSFLCGFLSQQNATISKMFIIFFRHGNFLKTFFAVHVMTSYSYSCLGSNNNTLTQQAFVVCLTIFVFIYKLYFKNTFYHNAPTCKVHLHYNPGCIIQEHKCYFQQTKVSF